MRILSFQSWDILPIILKNSEYFADANKTREKRDYKLDIMQLDGHQPIWGFQIPFTAHDFYDGAIFFTFKSEMSIVRVRDMSKFAIYMI